MVSISQQCKQGVLSRAQLLSILESAEALLTEDEMHGNSFSDLGMQEGRHAADTKTVSHLITAFHSFQPQNHDGHQKMDLISHLDSLFLDEGKQNNSSTFSIEPTPIGTFEMNMPLPPHLTIGDTSYKPNSWKFNRQQRVNDLSNAFSAGSTDPVPTINYSGKRTHEPPPFETLLIRPLNEELECLSSSESSIGSKRKRPFNGDGKDDLQPVAHCYRHYQTDQWKERFEELKNYKEQHGNCCVPHTYPENEKLARWVKRQRYQYKLKQRKGVQTTLSDDREGQLNDLGFVWSAHEATWQEKYEQLKAFKAKHGHCRVSAYVNTPLGAWVKFQRRQMKNFCKGIQSSMTQERFTQLDHLGFEWFFRDTPATSRSSGAGQEG